MLWDIYENVKNGKLTWHLRKNKKNLVDLEHNLNQVMVGLQKKLLKKN